MSKTADAMLLAIRTEHLTCDEPKCVACRAADEYEEALSRAPKAEGVPAPAGVCVAEGNLLGVDTNLRGAPDRSITRIVEFTLGHGELVGPMPLEEGQRVRVLVVPVKEKP